MAYCFILHGNGQVMQREMCNVLKLRVIGEVDWISDFASRIRPTNGIFSVADLT